MAKIIFSLLSSFCLFGEIIEIQQPHTLVLGINPKLPPIAPDTLRKLAYIGIEYTFNTTFQPKAETKTPDEWEGGIRFLSDFEGKAEVFRKWFEISLIKPDQIVIIDDR